MSRVGRAIIEIPNGVTVSFNNNILEVSGPKGKLTQEIKKGITPNIEGNVLSFTRINDQNEIKALHGLYRNLANNMIIGVTQGFSKSITINGVGYKATKSGNKVVLNVGFSHPVEIEEDEDCKLACPSATEIVVSGIDKAKVGQFASKIRDIRPVEPYHGYGVYYTDEVVIRKEGKTAGKKK